MTRRPDQSFQNLVKSGEETTIGSAPLAFFREPEEPGQLLPIETHYDFLTYRRDRDVSYAKSLELAHGSRIILNIPTVERNPVLRKKLFRAATGKSAGTVVDFDVLH